MARPNPHYQGTVEVYDIGTILCPDCLRELKGPLDKKARVIRFRPCCREWPPIQVEAFVKQIVLLKTPQVAGVEDANPQQIIARKKVR